MGSVGRSMGGQEMIRRTLPSSPCRAEAIYRCAQTAVCRPSYQCLQPSSDFNGLTHVGAPLNASAAPIDS